MFDLKKKQALIEEALSELLPKKNLLFEAARYSALAPGKRLRPILTLATLEAFGKDEKIGVVPACALELVHTYSLIHDDLPSMDNDDMRRGQPSLHKAYPESHAILTGDFLLTYAFELLTNSHHAIELIKILSQASGGDGMIMGQILDLEAEGKTLTLDELMTVHRLKTGCLISAAIEFGGVLADCDDQEKKILKEIGQELGLAFQIVDDLLDIDEVGKSTYPSLLGIEGTKIEADKLLTSALQKLRGLDCNSLDLEELALFIIERKS